MRNANVMHLPFVDNVYQNKNPVALNENFSCIKSFGRHGIQLVRFEQLLLPVQFKHRTIVEQNEKRENIQLIE